MSDGIESESYSANTSATLQGAIWILLINMFMVGGKLPTHTLISQLFSVFVLLSGRGREVKK